MTRLNTEMNKILAQKDMLDYFDTVGAQVYPTTPDGLRAYVDEDTTHLAFVRDGGDLAGEGLYVALEPWGSHFLAFAPHPVGMTPASPGAATVSV